MLAKLAEIEARLEQVVDAIGPIGALDVATFATRYSIGRSLVYELIAAGELPAAKVRGRRLIPIRGAEAWLRAQVPQAEAS